MGYTCPDTAEESTCEVGVRTPILTNEFVQKRQAALFQSEDGRERAREEDPFDGREGDEECAFAMGSGIQLVKKYNSRGSSAYAMDIRRPPPGGIRFVRSRSSSLFERANLSNSHWMAGIGYARAWF